MAVPRVLLGVTALLALEAVALVAVAVVAAADLVRGRAASSGLSVGVVVVALGIAAVLVASGRALLTGRRWGRAPALTWQLLQLAVAVPALLTAVALLPAVLAVVSLLVAVGLFHPDVVRHTRIGGEPPAL